jgi:hypothetical protein
MNLFRTLATALFSATLFAPSAFAMEFACARVDGAGAGDYDFSEICLNNEYAVVRTGSFESSFHFYTVEVSTEPRLSNTISFELTSAKASGMEPGMPMTVTVSQAIVSKDLLKMLKKGASVMIFGSPEQAGTSNTAQGFKVKNIPITL